MKRILMLLTALLIFSGCSLKIPKTGRGKTDAGNDSAVQQIGIKGSNGQDVPLNEAVIYDLCGVKVTSPGVNGNSPTLNVKNGSDRSVMLCSAYMAADGTLRSDLGISTDLIPPGGNSNITMEGLSGICSLKTRLYLKDENYSVIEGSLSDPIEFTLSSKLTLQPKQLYTLVYEDDKLLLGLRSVSYREDSNRVTLYLYAKNKTDKDLGIYSEDVECDHSDYYATLVELLPAGSSGVLTMRASTRNATLSPSQLDSVSMALSYCSIEEYFGFTGLDSSDTTERFTLKLPMSGRPENVIPDTIESTLTPDEYIADVTSSKDLVVLPLLGNYQRKYENDSICAELVLAALSTGSSGARRCSLHFRVQNKLDKQIRLAPIGVVNGGTANLYTSGGIKPMTEQYIEVTSAAIDESITGSFTDAALRFEYYYDDGSYDESSYLGTSDIFVVQCAETLSRPGVPQGAKQIYSDDNCDLYLLGIEKDEEYDRLEMNVYAVNKTDEIIIVSAMADEFTAARSLTMFGGSYIAGSFMLYSFDPDITLTPEYTEGMDIAVQVYDIDGNILSEGEGRL